MTRTFTHQCVTCTEEYEGDPGDTQCCGNPRVLKIASHVPTQAARTQEITASAPSMLLRDGWAIKLEEIGKEPHLIDGVLEQGTAAWMIGPSGSYKSFMALDMAACVAVGKHWQGREVTKGPVIYVYAEGSKGWDRRMAVWAQTYGVPEDRAPLHMRPMPIQVGSIEWLALSELVTTLKPRLIVIDTQSQCTTGYQENSNDDMAKVVNQLNALAERSGASVLTVHHSLREAERARGASVLYDNVNSQLTVVPKEDDADGVTVRYVELRLTKAKDIPLSTLGSFAPAELTIDGAKDWKGRPVTSVLMVPFAPVSRSTECAPTPEDWAQYLWNAGIKEAMGRDKLKAAIIEAELKSVPTGSNSLALITRAHKSLCEHGGIPPMPFELPGD
ncbi:AAA family ATPase [Streptomyces sp. NPDC059835]|uniref:AAA family ATPase n=1 Tax=Streptomyces sp. NPDC059835 TaxID=3346967 RepID=UPI0036466F8C